MNEARLKRIVDAWIIAQGAEESSVIFNENRWAIDLVCRWSIRSKPNRLWCFIQAACNRELTEEIRSILSAGPLENLLSEWGASYISEVENLAARDKRFRSLLCGVWRNSMSTEVWERVRAAATDSKI